VVEAMNAPPQTNMNGKIKKSNKGEMPSKRSQGSNGKVNWTAVRLSTKGMASSDVGKIKWSLKVLQEIETGSAEEALGHLREYYNRLVEPDKESFCKHLGLSVAEAEAILSGAIPSASETAAETVVPNNTQAPEVSPGLGIEPTTENGEGTKASDNESATNSHNQPAATQPAPTPGSQPSSSKRKKRPSTSSDKKVQSAEPGAKEPRRHTPKGDATNATPIPSSDVPSNGAYEDHPSAAIFPLMDSDDLQGLADDILKNGLREKIVLLEQKILDGRNRYRACQIAGVEAKFMVFEGHDPTAFVLSKNIHRRNITKSQRAAIAADLLPLIENEARRKNTKSVSASDGQAASPQKTDVEKIPPAEASEQKSPQPTEESESQKSRDVAAKALDVNPRYVSYAKLIKNEAPDLHEQVKQGTITLTQAKKALAKRIAGKHSDPKAGKKVDPQPFTVIFWDQSAGDAPIPEILKDKTLASAVFFHLTAQPKFALGCKSKDGFCDAALFVVPVEASQPEDEHGGLVLHKPSCLFLVARTYGEVPKPETVPGQVIKGGAVEAWKMIEKMWPQAPCLIWNGNGTPPQGWQIT
jgi:ParB-like chromosome segregation protein Spo0J